MTVTMPDDIHARTDVAGNVVDVVSPYNSVGIAIVTPRLLSGATVLRLMPRGAGRA